MIDWPDISPGHYETALALIRRCVDDDFGLQFATADAPELVAALAMLGAAVVREMVESTARQMESFPPQSVMRNLCDRILDGLRNGIPHSP